MTAAVAAPAAQNAGSGRDRDQELATLRAAGVRIPSCPRVVADLQQVLANPDSPDQAVALLIGRDLKLASVVFKTVNSAAYTRGRGKFTTLKEAVAVLGRQTIATMVRLAALQLTLSGPDARLVRFWERSRDIAMLCNIVTEQAPGAGSLGPDEAFIAGLFHDCGMAVLMQHSPAYCQVLADPRLPLPDTLEQDRQAGISHCAVGQMVAREWDLPAFVCETIAFHHAPLARVPAAGMPASAVVLMATHVLNVMTGSDDAGWAEQHAAVKAQLQLADSALPGFERDVWESFQVLH